MSNTKNFKGLQLMVDLEKVVNHGLFWTAELYHDAPFQIVEIIYVETYNGFEYPYSLKSDTFISTTNPLHDARFRNSAHHQERPVARTLVADQVKISIINTFTKIPPKYAVIQLANYD